MITHGDSETSNGKSFSHDEKHERQEEKSDDAMSVRDRVDSFIRIGRALPRRLQGAFKSNPAAVVAGVGAVTFVLGTVVGSKVARVLVTAVVGYGLNRLVEGPMGREIGRRAKEAIKQAESTTPVLA